MLVTSILLLVLIVVAATVLMALTDSVLMAALAVVLALAGTFATLRLMARYLSAPDRVASSE